MNIVEEKEVGKVTHFYTNLGVAIIELSEPLITGDKIHIKGATSDFEQTVNSIQIEHETVEKAQAGQIIGLKVIEKVRDNDVVFKVPSP